MSKENKNCNCITDIRKMLEEKFGEVNIDLAMGMDRETGKVFVKPQPMYFSYKKKKADGQPEKRDTKSFIAFSHCPFCGKEYSK